MTNSSAFHVWAIVLLSANMQNVVVNRFRRRSDAEDCLSLLQRAKPAKDYTIMYAPPEKGLEEIMRAIPPQSWAMRDVEGGEKVNQMMCDLYRAIRYHPLPRIRCLLESKLELISESHPEAYGKEVRDMIANQLTRWACQIHELPEIAVLPPDYWNL